MNETTERVSARLTGQGIPDELYVKVKGMYCPFCSSSDIAAQGYANAWCKSCDRKWEEVFQLTGYTYEGDDREKPPTKRPQVIIKLEGGLVESVFSDTELDVKVCDMDPPDFATEDEALEHETKVKQCEEVIKNLKEVY